MTTILPLVHAPKNIVASFIFKVGGSFINLGGKTVIKYRLEAKGEVRAVARTLIGGGGVYIHIFMFCPTSFFSNQIQIDQFEKKSVGQNMNI